jgi:hypothetical protein
VFGGQGNEDGGRDAVYMGSRHAVGDQKSKNIGREARKGEKG